MGWDAFKIHDAFLVLAGLDVQTKRTLTSFLRAQTVFRVLLACFEKGQKHAKTHLIAPMGDGRALGFAKITCGSPIAPTHRLRKKMYLCTQMLITLTGFMGSGKTTVGRLLAETLGCPFMDLDELIVKKAGKSIPDIFAQDGEPAFRLLEARLLKQTVEKYSENMAVLALGGGAVMTPASAELLHEKTVCIYLRATIDTLLGRLQGETAGRPLADDAMASRLAAREPVYEKTAHVTLDTDGLSPEEVVDELIIDCL